MGERELGELQRIIESVAELIRDAQALLSGQCTHAEAVEVTTMGSAERRWHCRKCGKIVTRAGVWP